MLQGVSFLTVQNRINDINERFKTGRITSDLKFDYWKLDSIRTMTDLEVDDQVFNVKQHLLDLSSTPNRFKIVYAFINGCLIGYTSAKKFAYEKAQAYINYTYFMSEYKFKLWLDNFGIKYIKEFPIKYLHTDFYLPDYNLCVEVNGCHEIDKQRCIKFVQLGYKVVNITETPKSWEGLLNNQFSCKLIDLPKLPQPRLPYGINHDLVSLLYTAQSQKLIINKQMLKDACHIKRWEKVRERLLNLYKKYEVLRQSVFINFNTLDDLAKITHTTNQGRTTPDINLILY